MFDWIYKYSQTPASSVDVRVQADCVLRSFKGFPDFDIELDQLIVVSGKLTTRMLIYCKDARHDWLSQPDR